MRKEFERITPEEAGVPSAAVEALLDKLEDGRTEPHGLMLMRHGKVFAEGWWAPYAPGLRHGLQSHTKTYAATAVGIACTEGILKLTDRIADIFPEDMPENPSENLLKLTVHDVLCMGCGMETMPFPTEHWIKDFLATPVVHEPGTAFMYNSTGSTFLGAIVRKVTGLGLHEYLKPRLFDKIGIDADNLHWTCMPDGMEVGGGGLSATTEDNLRLMKLYADGGVWEGERILSEDYVKKAISFRNDSSTERAVNPPAEDNFVGYGYQIWMCRPQGVYRADGAMGQFTIVFPERDMLLAITENASGITGGAVPQGVLDTIWEWVDTLPAPSVEQLPADGKAAAHLKRRLEGLCLPKPPRSAESPLAAEICGKAYKVTEGRFCPDGGDMGRFMSGSPAPAPAEEVSLCFCPGAAVLKSLAAGELTEIRLAMDGSYAENHLKEEPSLCLGHARWEDDSTLLVTFRMVQTCNERVFRFRFEGNALEITELNDHPFFKAPGPVKLVKA